MAGVFDLKTGAFDSSEAARLYKAYDIALQGLRASHQVDQLVVNRLARSIVKVARTEPDCLKNDGTIDPIRLAQRAILRMLQLSAPAIGTTPPSEEPPRPVSRFRTASRAVDGTAISDGPGKVMLRLFDRTVFSKL